MKRGIVGLIVVLMGGLLSLVLLAPPGNADSVDYAKTWQTKFGARIHGYIQFRASHVYQRKHVKRAYVRLTREAGPSLDTGRAYTSTAPSRRNSRLRYRQKDVWDSPLWGDKFVTHFYHGFQFFR